MAIFIYAIAVPLSYAIVLRRSSNSPLTSFLRNDYTPRARWWELVEVSKKLLLTGFLALLEPGSSMQLFVAVATAIVIFALQLHVSPFRRPSDSLLGIVSEMSLAFTLLGTLALRTSSPVGDEDDSGLVVTVLIIAAVAVALVAVLMLLADVGNSMGRARWAADDSPVVAPQIASG